MPFIGAAYSGPWNLVCLLIEHKAKINAPWWLTRSALIAAALSGHESLVRLLVERRADVNTHGSAYGATLGVVTATAGDEILARLLIEHGPMSMPRLVTHLGQRLLAFTRVYFAY
ncbi:hypothetical protein BDD12DRAFT_850519 [Trichophaea hybrida]|nr:hypothetical protein BDD12DRAFT_850519 [Trichophaea hybrida]